MTDWVPIRCVYCNASIERNTDPDARAKWVLTDPDRTARDKYACPMVDPPSRYHRPRPLPTHA